MGAYDVFPGLGHMEQVTFSTQGSCPGALPPLVGVHTEVCRTKRLWLPPDRVRRILLPHCRAREAGLSSFVCGMKSSTPSSLLPLLS